MTTDSILSVRDLQTAFFTDKEVIRAVDGVDFDLAPGTTTGIVGESGSGKSVTARSIMGLVESPGRILDGSSIRFEHADTVREFAERFPERAVTVGSDAASTAVADPDGDDPSALYDHPRVDESDCIFVTEGDASDPSTIEDGFVELTRCTGEVQRAMRGGRIAMVFQDPLTSLNPVYTVGNQIEEALELHQDLSGQAATREAISLLEDVGIPDARRRVSEYPHQFSGGMQQRAVIAMALACDPEVLICDEPTTALDVTIQAQILDLLADLQETRDLAIMFITHDMGVIAEIADRVNVMYAGEIVETAGVEELFAAPKHPYTRGLLEAIPGRHGGERLRTIEGSVPTPNEPATYCRFAPRCPEATEECSKIHPDAVPIDGGDGDHTAACLLYPEELPTEATLERHLEAGVETDAEPGAKPDTSGRPTRGDD
ncbi:ABC transporter ATP-binding protein [Natrinema salifodinae]|uniref:Nickel import system ATP-binding protein NikD n=1 Tax=Natrinema salifodinae TaxID=1202768 RepID=A0A1I0NJU4_9EURY|nr:ABC transporter ATP-binding protein [Natrinema salifodinae]SEW01583.1 peptide/nickel transport system ATP-binding protein [Natrinema salifodinae]